MLTPVIRDPKRCPQNLSRVLVPLSVLGAIGFLINSRVSFGPGTNYCSPKTNIVFLKTHKCAGSSIQNILMRYGDVHNLTFVLPRAANYLGHPQPFDTSFLAQPQLATYNILAHHTRLNYSAIRALMPPDSVYITIIRDPVQLFESSYSYYELRKFYRCDLHKFIKWMPRFSRKLLDSRFRGKFGVNQMSFDLGADPSTFHNDSLILDHLDRLESWFDLVLVSERMDESLVLLRHLLCWSTDDVVAFKMNARSPEFKSQLSMLERQKLRDLNRADVLLYKRFLAKFDAQVSAFGRERMDSEVSELRRRTQLWYDICVSMERIATTAPSTKLYVNPRVMTFEPRDNASNDTCKLLTSYELLYTDYLRMKQAPDSNTTSIVL